MMHGPINIRLTKYYFVVFFLFGDSPATSYEDETDSVPKYQYIIFRNREITPPSKKKKEYNNQYTAKVCNQDKYYFVGFVCIICSLCIVPFIVLLRCAVC